jgi:hypothetical protein
MWQAEPVIALWLALAPGPTVALPHEGTEHLWPAFSARSLWIGFGKSADLVIVSRFLHSHKHGELLDTTYASHHEQPKVLITSYRCVRSLKRRIIPLKRPWRRRHASKNCHGRAITGSIRIFDLLRLFRSIHGSNSSERQFTCPTRKRNMED